MPNKLKKYSSPSTIECSSLVDIGETNVKNWSCLKIKLGFKTDSDFVEYLLSLAKKYLSTKSVENHYNDNEPPKEKVSTRAAVAPLTAQSISNGGKLSTLQSYGTVAQKEVAGRKEVGKSQTMEEKDENSNPVERWGVHYENRNRVADDLDVNDKEETNSENSKQDTKLSTKRCWSHENRKKKLRETTNARKSKDGYESTSSAETASETKGIAEIENGKIEDQLEKSVPPRSEICRFCDCSHSQDYCPLDRPCTIVRNSPFTLQGHKADRCKSSLPDILEIRDKGGKDCVGIFSRTRINKYTQFGPLVGESIKEMEIADDSSMKHIWEVRQGVYLNTADPEKSNWLRWLCPAPTRHDRNVVPVEREGKLFFVTTTLVESGCELFYWAEMIGAWASKKMERNSCGGCNLQFEHPMYYRIHCAVFHEASLSLTVRKYHCKVCGKSVLGKQNIMKHALINHEGKGAYQCQFCSKFFLRLNYLEMHKNYGCSANPHRARPLCDYCGRKFCQPQKLKVHIKRMHSDLAEVLHEFQCRDCLKILGSRAALQRHTKEVHKRPSGVSCSKCAKTFQNKSNLKIHMLTHSGVKPFQCQEKKCSAAFTTKQCLQFHYKKVHGLSEDRFPSIVRSVEYTFESYSGAKESSLDDKDGEDDWSQDNQSNWQPGRDSGAEDTNIVETQRMSPPPPTEPTCEETSVIEYHSSSSAVKAETLNRIDLKEDTGLCSRITTNGVIMAGQASTASLLVEAALESAEKELRCSLPANSPPMSPMGEDNSSSLDPLQVSSPSQSLGSPVVNHSSELHHLDQQKVTPPLTPQHTSVMYETGVRPYTPTVCSPQQITYLSPRYERHYLTPPPPPHEFAHDDRRYHEEEFAQNLTKYKYEEARMMYHELIPRYPMTPGDYYPWEVLRPAVNLPSSMDLSVSTGHLVPPIERPTSPFQAFHIPHKSPAYHHYATYY